MDDFINKFRPNYSIHRVLMVHCLLLMVYGSRLMAYGPCLKASGSWRMARKPREAWVGTPGLGHYCGFLELVSPKRGAGPGVGVGMLRGVGVSLD